VKKGSGTNAKFTQNPEYFVRVSDPTATADKKKVPRREFMIGEYRSPKHVSATTGRHFTSLKKYTLADKSPWK
jgi:hypothetical protein